MSCSLCSSNGHDCRTCSSSSDSPKDNEVTLFGVKISADPLRKTVSVNDVSQYQHVLHEPPSAASTHVGVSAGYASADDNVNHSRERKRGIPWTEEEHKLFLLGLQKVGKGNWKEISRNYVKTRTLTQVASHAQKYFKRQANLNRRRLRPSIFDITTDTVATMSMENNVFHQDNASLLHLPMLETGNTSRSPPVPYYPMPFYPQQYISTPPTNLIRPIPSYPQHPALSAMDLWPLSLKLALSANQTQTLRHSTFQMMSKLNNRDNKIIIID